MLKNEVLGTNKIWRALSDSKRYTEVNEYGKLTWNVQDEIYIAN